jgi:hypothetical protein
MAVSPVIQVVVVVVVVVNDPYTTFVLGSLGRIEGS